MEGPFRRTVPQTMPTLLGDMDQKRILRSHVDSAFESRRMAGPINREHFGQY